MHDSPKKIFLRMISIVILGFFLNLLWEVLHSLLYDWNQPPLVNNIYIYIPRIIFFATLFDAFWIFSFILWNSLFHLNLKWILRPKLRDYAVFLVIGLITAIFIELSAIIFNSWEYNVFMPQLFGIGITPLIQLALTGIVSLYIISHVRWQE